MQGKPGASFFGIEIPKLRRILTKRSTKKTILETTTTFVIFFMQRYHQPKGHIVKLYPSVDTELLLEFLIQTIYSDNRANQMLPRYRDDSNNLIRPIPKTILKPVLAAVLTKLTAFRCIDKYYRQIKGLAMGDSSSPKLANFYLHMLEKDKIRKLMDDGIIVGYKRFQDDTIVIFKKGFSEIVKSTFESLHESLKITMEKPGENGFSLLDFVIYEKDGQLEIKKQF